MTPRPQEQQQRSIPVAKTRSASTTPSPEPATRDSHAQDGTETPRSHNDTLSTAYNLFMTPVNLVAFLLSLVLIDLRYSLQRQHTHSESRSRLPVWLRTLFYRPYENERTRASSVADGQWYYHTKQKKLFKMEADEAFRFRGTMLFVLGAASLGGLIGLWYTLGYLARLPGQRLY